MPTYPLAIAFADLAVGMAVQSVTTWTGTGQSETCTGTVTALVPQAATLDTGCLIPAPEYVPDGQAVTIAQTAPFTPPPAEPAAGSAVLDETGKLWQRLGDLWCCIDDTTTDWDGLRAAHTLTTLTPVAPTPLGPAGSGYPVTITPAGAMIGMDVRVTTTFTSGGTRVIRGLVAWNQDNAENPDYLRFGLATGAVIQYNPPADGVASIVVEQMNTWTNYGQSVGVAEPATGAVLLAGTGLAWQRIGTATSDSQFVLTGQGIWRPVAGESTTLRSWFWAWGAGAPWTEMT